jgi:hypothetical protein
MLIVWDLLAHFATENYSVRKQAKCGIFYDVNQILQPVLALKEKHCGEPCSFPICIFLDLVRCLVYAEHTVFPSFVLHMCFLLQRICCIVIP